MGLDRVVSGVGAVLLFTYPFLVYIGWQRIQPRWILGGAMVLFGLRLCLMGRRMDRSQWKGLAWPWILPAIFLLTAFVVGRRSLFLYWPVIISAALLLTFGLTLLHPPTLVERFARVQKSDLTEAEITYCRKVTQTWCAFFIGNALMALILAWGCSLKVWTLYNGLISYILIGTLMGSEYVYRHWRFRPENDWLTKWMNQWTR